VHKIHKLIAITVCQFHINKNNTNTFTLHTTAMLYCIIIALLSSQESYSLPVLMYAMPARSLKSKQLDELNVCWNNVIRRMIFNYNKWESVKSVLFHVNRFNITHLIMMRKINFYRRLHMSRNVFCTMLCRFCHIVAIVCVARFLLTSHLP